MNAPLDANAGACLRQLYRSSACYLIYLFLIGFLVSGRKENRKINPSPFSMKGGFRTRERYGSALSRIFALVQVRRLRLKSQEQKGTDLSFESKPAPFFA